MRVRQEAKILKNFKREGEWDEFFTEEGELFEYPKSRYKPSRLDTAHCRLVKAYRRRMYNEARRQRKQGESDAYWIHTANYFPEEEAYRWWNI